VLRLIVVSLVSVAALAGAGQAGSVDKNTTVMIERGHTVGDVQRDTAFGPRWMAIHCADSNAYLVWNRQYAWINVHGGMDEIWGWSRRDDDLKWTSYRYTNSKPYHRVAGYAIRRSATQWDVFKASKNGRVSYHYLGHTVGLYGPQGAAAMLIVCG
jgi:hypothetical protein